MADRRLRRGLAGLNAIVAASDHPVAQGILNGMHLLRDIRRYARAGLVTAILLLTGWIAVAIDRRHALLSAGAATSTLQEMETQRIGLAVWHGVARPHSSTRTEALRVAGPEAARVLNGLEPKLEFGKP